MFTAKQHRILTNLTLDRANDHCIAAAVRTFMAEPAYNEELTIQRLRAQGEKHESLAELIPAIEAL